MDLGSRHELTDTEWEFIRPSRPRPRRGRSWLDDHRSLNGIVWKFRAGVARGDVPERYGSMACRCCVRLAGLGRMPRGRCRMGSTGPLFQRGAAPGHRGLCGVEPPAALVNDPAAVTDPDSLNASTSNTPPGLARFPQPILQVHRSNAIQSLVECLGPS
ncbi:transposase [Streptomyces sp. NPDC088789]|uniref:transposase n=1 Tax=Streptomyces sp. NPDC088789 TaxID=3365899 RepID=UPI00382C15F4